MMPPEVVNTTLKYKYYGGINRCVKHHLAKLSGGQKVVCPLLNVVQGNVEPAFLVNQGVLQFIVL